MTKRTAERKAREAAKERAAKAQMIGTRHRNAGMGLTVGDEWNTSDGFRVRQIAAIPSIVEPGHFVGILEVIGLAHNGLPCRTALQ